MDSNMLENCLKLISRHHKIKEILLPKLTHKNVKHCTFEKQIESK